jgi:hypothetical protein
MVQSYSAEIHVCRCDILKFVGRQSRRGLERAIRSGSLAIPKVSLFRPAHSAVTDRRYKAKIRAAGIYDWEREPDAS